MLKASNSKRRHRKAGSSNRADWRGSEKAGRALDGDLDEHGGDLDYIDDDHGGDLDEHCGDLDDRNGDHGV